MVQEDPIRVAIADDHLVVREGLRFILQANQGLLYVGEATNGVEALQLAIDATPHVFLMDLRMPDLDGIQTIERLRREHPTIAVIILTTYDEDDLMLRGLQAGAQGYLLKDASRDTLFHAIRTAARGEMFLQPQQVARMLGLNTCHISSPPEEQLTKREIEVLSCVARGERNKEIGRHLGITERTVKAHLASLYLKLKVDSRTAAVAEALKLGIIAP